MINTYLLVAECIICLVVMLIIYKTSKLEGLYAYIIVSFVISNLMSLKIISLYNFDLNLGIIPFATIFIASNIIVQKYGKDEIKRLILILVAMSVISFGILYITSLLNSSNINLFTNKSYDNIFSYNNILSGSVRIFFANIVTILYALLLNSKLYYYLKTEKNKIWISNLFSAIITNFLSCILFPVLAYALIKEPMEIVRLIIIRYMVILVVSIIGTINIYIANKIKEK